MSWKYFTESEMACKHCGENGMHPRFMQRLELLREKMGIPLIISSGYRCPDHNQAVTKTGTAGPHTTGRAVDIRISGEKAYELVLEAINLGFDGIGVSQKGPHSGRFIHIDDLPNGVHPRPRIWSY